MPDKVAPVKRILFCTDFSPNANLAFDHAIEAAVRRPGCELYLLHVIPAPDAQFWKTYIKENGVDINQKAKDDIDAKINQEYRAKVPPEVQFKPVFRIGKAYMEIIAFAREIDANLIVMGRQGGNALESLFFGTVAEKVVKRAKCPVLVIPLT